MQPLVPIREFCVRSFIHTRNRDGPARYVGHALRLGPMLNHSTNMMSDDTFIESSERH